MSTKKAGDQTGWCVMMMISCRAASLVLSWILAGQAHMLNRSMLGPPPHHHHHHHPPSSCIHVSLHHPKMDDQSIVDDDMMMMMPHLGPMPYPDLLCQARSGLPPLLHLVIMRTGLISMQAVGKPTSYLTTCKVIFIWYLTCRSLYTDLQPCLPYYLGTLNY